MRVQLLCFIQTFLHVADPWTVLETGLRPRLKHLHAYYYNLSMNAAKLITPVKHLGPSPSHPVRSCLNL